MPNAFIDTSARPGLYFFHVPKTGGMSLRAYFADQYLESERCPAVIWSELAAIPPEAMQGYRLFQGHFSANLLEHLPPGTRSVTFLREPVGRTISTIRHLIRDPLFHPMHHRVKGRTLRDVIYDDQIMRSLRDLQTRLLSFDVPIEDVLGHVRQKMASNQFVELTGLDWTPSLAKALRVLGTYDVVGLMDRFEESLLAISERFGFLPPEVMPGLNKALDGIDPDRALSEQDIAHIEGYLTDDLELYRVAAERLHASTADRSSMLAGLFSKGIIRQVDGPLELDLGRPFPGSGWYAPERQGDHLVRWSGPASRAMLYLPIDRDRRRSLQIAVVKPAFVPGVHIYLDADRAEPRVTQDGQVLRLEVDVPEQSAPERPWTTITVDTMHASTPGERGDSDLRTLGVLLLSVSVT